MQRGFSLVELSIVLVILGLLTGGILAGQSLIRASELRAVVSEYQRYTTAVMTFRDKYGALPGDMVNATSFWGTAHLTPATCKTTNSGGAATCNGDGNGWIGEITGSVETARFWQHLANAGLIEGNYAGTNLGSINFYGSVPGSNVPRSKLNNAGWGVFPTGVNTGADTGRFTGDYGNELTFGTTNGNADLLPEMAVLKPEEAWNLDTKMDDGLPARGRVYTRYIASCTTASSSTDSTGTYNLNNSNVLCSLKFLKAL